MSGGCTINIEGRPKKPPLDQETQFISESCPENCRAKNSLKFNGLSSRLYHEKRFCYYLKSCWKNLVIALLVAFVIALSLALIFQIAKWPAVLKAPLTSDAPRCLPGWKEKGGKCYFFSDVERNWTSSQNHCSSYRASLVTLDNQEEMDFVLRFIGRELYWIGFQREDVDKPWKLPDGSLFSNWFPIRLGGHCAYLAEDSVRSTSCSLIRFWMCSKPATFRDGQISL